MSAPAHLEVVDALGELAPRWDALVATQPLPSPFLRSWWVDNAASATPTILVVRRGEELLGGAAFEVERIGGAVAGLQRVRCLGQGVLAPDHLDLIAAPGHHREVAAAVTGWLRRRGNRIVDLDGLAATGTLGTVFAPSVIERVGAPYATIPTPDPAGVEAYLADRPGRVRSTIKRTAKRLEKLGVTLHSSDGDIAGPLERLARLHGTRWEDESDFLEGWSRFSSAVAAGARAGEVRIHELVAADGETVAAEIDLRVGGRLCFYQAGRRTEHEWRGAGSDLRARILRSEADGLDEYDLLRGDEPYKSEWADHRRMLVRCRFGVGVGTAVLRAHELRVRLGRREPDPSR